METPCGPECDRCKRRELEAKLEQIKEYGKGLRMRVSGTHPDVRRAMAIIQAELAEMLEG